METQRIDVKDAALSSSELAILNQIRSSLRRRGQGHLKDSGTGKSTSPLPRAAVCVILSHDASKKELCVLIIKKKERSGDPWSGHMAFPGGRLSETKDSNILDTAKRETMEETGIDISECEILGTLDEVMPSSLRSILVTPFVVFASRETKIRLNENEIVEHFWVPFSYFAEDRNITPSVITPFGSPGERIQVPSFRLSEGAVVWGLTFRIIQNLLERMKGKD